jgi:hypothetical protein
LVGFAKRCEILSDLWANYRDDDDFADFVDYHLLGLALAHACAQGIATLAADGEAHVNDAFDRLLQALGRDAKQEWPSLDAILEGAQESTVVSQVKEWETVFRPIPVEQGFVERGDGYVYEVNPTNVLKAAATDPRHVWSLLWLEDTFLATGYVDPSERRRAMVVGYVFTEVPWDDDSQGMTVVTEKG